MFLVNTFAGSTKQIRDNSRPYHEFVIRKYCNFRNPEDSVNSFLKSKSNIGSENKYKKQRNLH